MEPAAAAIIVRLSPDDLAAMIAAVSQTLNERKDSDECTKD